MQRAWLMAIVACGGSASAPAGTADPIHDAGTAAGKGKGTGKGKGDTAPAITAVQVGAAWSTVLVRMSDGTLRGWGRQTGELGAKDGTEVTTPQPIPGVSGAVDLVLDEGLAAACARDASAQWTCWGDRGDLPSGGTDDTTPIAEPALAGSTLVRFGAWFGCAVRPDRHVLCWGQLPVHADAKKDTRSAPIEVPGIDDAIDLALDSRLACALRAGGDVVCWGVDESGSDGFDPASYHVIATPTPVDGVHAGTSLALGYGLGCVRTGAGFLSCWDAAHHVTPIPDLPGARFLPESGLGICEIARDRKVRCIAKPDSPGDAPQVTPVETPPAIDFATDLSGGEHCAVTVDGEVACGGKNDAGQLGDGTAIDHQDLRTVADLVDTKPPPATPAIPVDPDARATDFAARPDRCAVDASIEIVHDGWGGDLPLVSAWAKADEMSIDVFLRDHPAAPTRAFDLDLRGAHRGIELSVMIKGPKSDTDLRRPTVGRYPILADMPKAGHWAGGAFHSSTRYDDFALDPPMSGAIAITHIDSAWICGSIDVAGHGMHVRGRFAAEIVADPY